MAFISRDEYAREELHRETIKTDKTCDWCGQNKKLQLFRYYIEPDALRYQRHDIPGLFCSISCMRIYSS